MTAVGLGGVPGRFDNGSGDCGGLGPARWLDCSIANDQVTADILFGTPVAGTGSAALAPFACSGSGTVIPVVAGTGSAAMARFAASGTGTNIAPIAGTGSGAMAPFAIGAGTGTEREVMYGSNSGRWPPSASGFGVGFRQSWRHV